MLKAERVVLLIRGIEGGLLGEGKTIEWI